MEELTLISSYQRPLRPLVEAALQNELRLLQVNSKRTEQNLNKFEARFGLSTSEFIQGFENDELPETLDYVECPLRCKTHRHRRHGPQGEKPRRVANPPGSRGLTYPPARAFPEGLCPVTSLPKSNS